MAFLPGPPVLSPTVGLSTRGSAEVFEMDDGSWELVFNGRVCLSDLTRAETVSLLVFLGVGADGAAEADLAEAPTAG